MISEKDIEFLEKKVLPYFGLKSIAINYSPSTERWPDIWIKLDKVPPMITVTREWARQSVHERRKRLTHEFLHLTGMEHDESIGYSTYPSRDSYSKKVYKELIK